VRRRAMMLSVLGVKAGAVLKMIQQLYYKSGKPERSDQSADRTLEGAGTISPNRSGDVTDGTAVE